METLVLAGPAATFLRALTADRAWRGAVWFTTTTGDDGGDAVGDVYVSAVGWGA